MKRYHHVGPNAAAGMTPQRPRHLVDFRMTRLHGEIGKPLEKSFLRTVARIEPQLRGPRRSVDLLVLHMIAGTPERAVPLLRQRLPVHVVGSSGTFDGRRRPRAVLMH